MKKYMHHRETYRAKPTDWLAAAAVCGLLLLAAHLMFVLNEGVMV